MAYFRCGNGNSGGGGELSETLLWENSNPSSGYSDGLISISSDFFSNYTYLRFEYLKKYNLAIQESNLCKVMCSVEDFKKTQGVDGISGYIYLDSKHLIRGTLYYSEDKRIYVYRAYDISNDAYTTYYLVPYRIYGLK